MRLWLVWLGCLSWALAINNNPNAVAQFLHQKTFSVDGKFYYYDFPNVESLWDYVFEDSRGTQLQLRGKTPSNTDVFGWKVVNVALQDQASYWFVYMGDFDSDGDERFDWLLLQPTSKVVHKLTGQTHLGTLAWSKALPVDLEIENARVSFKAKNPSTTTPVLPGQGGAGSSGSTGSGGNNPSPVPPSIPTNSATGLERPPSIPNATSSGSSGQVPPTPF